VHVVRRARPVDRRFPIPGFGTEPESGSEGARIGSPLGSVGLERLWTRIDAENGERTARMGVNCRNDDGGCDCFGLEPIAVSHEPIGRPYRQPRTTVGRWRGADGRGTTASGRREPESSRERSRAGSDDRNQPEVVLEGTILGRRSVAYRHTSLVSAAPVDRATVMG
jgi:hypothetical protein